MKLTFYKNYVIIKDPVYGSFKITEPVLIALLKSKVILRLKEIRQQGLPKKWHYGIEFSRYEHSVGVLLLLEKFNAPLKEKIAGLLHDASHMAFSHLYDYLLENQEEAHGDNIFYGFLKKDKEIIKIFKKYKISLEEISDFKNYPLLERDAPDLCADRLDYTFREFYYYKKDKNTLERMVNDLIVVENEIIFNTKKSALNFYKNYKYFAENHWGGKLHMYKYNLFIDLLKKALSEKIIYLRDFYKTDDYIIKKIKKFKDPLVSFTINKLKNKNLKVPEDYSAFSGKKRFVNPKYLSKGQVKKVI
ncbi:HD domain-containing protein [archaeon]|nr:HD domain-containing protein [archaeon]NCP79233.1 HD domain-containing protein [archaeon]NCP97820.1 HD domain-containing protein [archaeon]NCQ07000.1 HD domain-containing protein [archaeon]NCQ50796.1 HD domain-containing protein [archaeon]